MISLSSIIKEQRHHAERALWYLAYDFKKENGISQKEMAERLSVSTSAVSKWEHGKNLPDITMLGSIAEILQVSCDELLNPEMTLERLANSELQKGDTEETDGESPKKRVAGL